MKKLAFSSVAFAVLLQLSAYYTLFHRTEPFMYQFYLLVWWSFIIFLDGALVLKTGRHFALHRRLFSLATVSAAFWCIFELLNLRMQNWFYSNISPDSTTVRYCGYFLAFATVVPAILLVTRLLAVLLPEIKGGSVRLHRLHAYPIPLGIVCLILCLALPRYFFGLAWVFLMFIVDEYNYRKGYASFMRDLERGVFTRIVVAALAGVVCGFFWEFWNYWSITKWVYTVPFLEGYKLFEMPAVGYVGFAVFGLEVIALVNLLEGAGFFRKTRWLVILPALLFCVVSFNLIERYTVFSYVAPVQHLSFLSPETEAALEARGVGTTYAIDPAMLSPKEREGLALVELKGLGVGHTEELQAQGVGNVSDLAKLDERELGAIIGESNMRRVRVYLRAAREASSSQP